MSASASRKRGRQRELDYIAHLTRQGWSASRTEGAGDIIAGKNGVTILIQSKSTVGPYDHFGPKDRLRLKDWCDNAGWFAYLLWWPKGTGLEHAQLIPEEEWPAVAAAA